MQLANVNLLKQGQNGLFTQALWQLIDSSHTLKMTCVMCCNLSHGHWLCILHFHYAMAICILFKCNSQVTWPNNEPQHVMTIQTIFKLHLWGVAKIPIPKFSLFLKLDHFAPGFLTVHLKFDFLHWPFLMNSNYAPWKYMSNGVCT